MRCPKTSRPDGSKPSASGETSGHQPARGFVQRGGYWVLCQSVLFLVIFPGGYLWSHQWHSQPGRVAGAILLCVGAGCGLAGALSLGRNLTPFPHPSEGSQLVQTGIYALIRHPLYTAVFSAATGWALLYESWPALVAALCLAPFFDAKARVEERALQAKFPEYTHYRSKVRRFIPWVY